MNVTGGGELYCNETGGSDAARPNGNATLPSRDFVTVTLH